MHKVQLSCITMGWITSRTIRFDRFFFLSLSESIYFWRKIEQILHYMFDTQYQTLQRKCVLISSRTTLKFVLKVRLASSTILCELRCNPSPPKMWHKRLCLFCMFVFILFLESPNQFFVLSFYINFIYHT